jgi:hypothetical protein
MIRLFLLSERQMARISPYFHCLTEGRESTTGGLSAASSM